MSVAPLIFAGQHPFSLSRFHFQINGTGAAVIEWFPRWNLQHPMTSTSWKALRQKNWREVLGSGHSHTKKNTVVFAPKDRRMFFSLEFLFHSDPFHNELTAKLKCSIYVQEFPILTKPWCRCLYVYIYNMQQPHNPDHPRKTKNGPFHNKNDMKSWPLPPPPHPKTLPMQPCCVLTCWIYGLLPSDFQHYTAEAGRWHTSVWDQVRLA